MRPTKHSLIAAVMLSVVVALPVLGAPERPVSLQDRFEAFMTQIVAIFAGSTDTQEVVPPGDSQEIEDHQSLEEGPSLDPAG